MIITRTPLRISFVGGATDIANYYTKFGGEVISCAINRYMYVTVNKRDDDKIIISYSKTETVTRVKDIKHDIIREALKLANIKKSIEVHIIGEISTIGTGLGGSSAVAVGLLRALFPQKTQTEIAELSCKLEIEILGKDIGKQDQYSCAWGGLKRITFNCDGKVSLRNISPRILKDSLFLFKETTVLRSKAEDLLKEQNKQFDSNVENLHRIKMLCTPFQDALEKEDTRHIASIINGYMLLKRQLSNRVTNKHIDKHINNFKDIGCGVKICGAGESGFILVYDPNQICKGIPVNIDNQGTKIVFKDE